MRKAERTDAWQTEGGLYPNEEEVGKKNYHFQVLGKNVDNFIKALSPNDFTINCI